MKATSIGPNDSHRRLIPALVLLSVLVLAGAHLLFVARDHSTLGSDEAMYVRAALAMKRVLAFEAAPSFREVVDPLGSRQPLPAWAAAPFLLLGGDPATAARASNIIPLVLLVLSTYLLALRLAAGGGGGGGAGGGGSAPAAAADGKRAAALAAVLVTLLYPPLVHLSRVFWAHYWLVAMVPLALLSLIAARGLRSARASAGLGLVLGLGLLTRHFFALFMLVPLLLFGWDLWQAYRAQARGSTERRRLVRHGATTTVIVLALAAPHYAYAWKAIRNTMKAAAEGGTSCFVPYDSAFLNALWFPAQLLREGSLLFGLTFILLLVAGLAALRDWEQRLTLGAGLGGLLLINLYHCKVLEYALPCVAPLVAVGFAGLPHLPAVSRRGVVAGAGLATVLGLAMMANDFGGLFEGVFGSERAARLADARVIAVPRRPASADANDLVTMALGRLVASHERERSAASRAAASRAPERVGASREGAAGEGGRPVLALVADYPIEKNRVDLALLAAGVVRRESGFYGRAPGEPKRLDVAALLRSDYLVLLAHQNTAPVWLWQVQDALKPGLGALQAATPLALLNYRLLAFLPSLPGPTWVYMKEREPTGTDIEALLAASLSVGADEEFALGFAGELLLRASVRGEAGAALAQTARATLESHGSASPEWTARAFALAAEAQGGADVAVLLEKLR